MLDHLLGAEAQAVEAWNALAEARGLPKVRMLTKSRLSRLKQRLAEAGWDGFREALDAIDRSAFLCGRNDRGWRADFDFVLQQSSFVKLLEGRYDRTRTNNDPLAAAAAGFVGRTAPGGERGLDVQARLSFGGGAE